MLRRLSGGSSSSAAADAPPGVEEEEDEEMRLALVASLELSRKEDAERREKEQRDRAQRQEEEAALPVPVAAQVDSCEICCEDLDAAMRKEIGGRRVTATCRHGRAICWSCVSKTVLEELNGKGNVEEVTCPHNECRERLEHEDVRYFTKKDDFTRYDGLKLRRALQGMDEFRWCAASGCGGGQLTEGGEAAMNFMRCGTCERLTCLRHRCAMHEGMSCDEYDEEARKSDEVALHQYLQSDAVTQCPKCGQGIEKKDGCDHMACNKAVGGCGAEFCWRCGADYNGVRGIRKRGNSAHKRTCQHYFANPEERDEEQD